MVNETFIIVLTWVCLGVIMCYPHLPISETPSNGSIQVCGSQLSNALALICKGSYNTMEPKTLSRHIRSSRKHRYPFKNHEDAKSFIRYRRRRRGVSDECCKKSCSMDEILTFCALK